MLKIEYYLHLAKKTIIGSRNYQLLNDCSIREIASFGMGKHDKYDPKRCESYEKYMKIMMSYKIRRIIYDISKDKLELKPISYFNMHEDWTHNPAHKAEQSELIGIVQNRLSKRDSYVLTKYYLEGLTLQEIGDIMGVTRERVRQCVNSALLNARKVLRVKNVVA